jgi:flagellin
VWPPRPESREYGCSHKNLFQKQGGKEMRINNNIMAMNAHRQLGVNQANSSKSMERLSSGMRINRAGDDAAGLAISEKMRGQIRGLKQAARNAQDGISLIQTAEGALNETHAILQRMRELATQASNDTNTAVDRAELQKEIDQLASEITRIADNTEFNTQNLLGGEFKAKFHIGANADQNLELSIDDMGSEALGVGTAFTASSDGTESEITSTITFTGANGDEVTATWSDVDDDYEVAGYYTEDNKLVLVASKALDDGTTGVFGITITDQNSANSAITAINDAIETVSAERSKLGAYQNRLEHTIANLGTSAENLQAAESRIRDLDMAEEMMAFTKNNILQQAATAMLAQANMAPQSVLQLLG